MKTNFEKQVAAFDKVLGHCNALGVQYKPGKDSLKVTALKSLLTAAQQSLQAVDFARSGYIIAINKRQSAFLPLQKIGTRLVNALAGTEASPQLIADMKLYLGKFRRASQAKKNATPEDGSQDPTIPAHSSPKTLSQLDFESKIRNFGTMIDLLKSEPTYKPAEADLTIAALTELLSTLREKHKAVMTAQIALSKARAERKKILFEADGIRPTIKQIKQYVLSVFGSDSEHYRQVRSISLKG